MTNDLYDIRDNDISLVIVRTCFDSAVTVFVKYYIPRCVITVKLQGKYSNIAV